LVRQSCSDSVWSTQKRTHLLSSGEYIWDFAGNVWELLDWTVTNLKAVDGVLTNTDWMEVNDLIVTANMAANSYKSSDTGLDSSNGIGMYYAGAEGAGGIATRGGAWNSGAASGIYALQEMGDKTYFLSRHLLFLFIGLLAACAVMAW